ncbi:alpha-2-macroglobulin family protein [Salinarimonas soli]|uniref:Alpha-2-macroglobulin family protein n=1 Tax=Salinarimonas soli TaxID=1638099 RepID=A0A5B2VS06_9HYPH|nr:alpha-2-macroglobulin [Salinarimonas soli]KAA2241032.1 alpha-2-macroglobulin family protein [Salinarimonas soli]
MRRLVHAAALAGALLVATQAQAQKSFTRDDLASEGVRLEERLRTESAASVGGRPAAQLRRDAETALTRSDPRRALSLASAALAAEPRDGANWLTYVKAARAVEPADWSERYRLQERSTIAAYMAYQRAANRADEAAALVQLAEVWDARSQWRPALNAYRASLDLADDARVRRAYEELREKRGFRITDYRVDSDSASPRACFEFSEDLARGRVDFAPFVAVSGAANGAVTAEGRQLCVDGLRHGERYAFVLRQGLPSSVGETLLKSADYEIYVRDRTPQARFTGRNYVLPRTGQEGIPVVTVNTDKVAVEVSRVGDRNLLPTLRSDDFLSQLSRYSAGQIGAEKGVKIWSGTLDVKNELNRDVVTAFPVLEAVGTLEPGVYVMTAKPPTSDNTDDDYGTLATQWFVVSDLGLTAFKGGDGVHVFARSLASAKSLAGVEVRLVARNNEILATKVTDANGHARFDPGLARGAGGMSPGLVTAGLSGDYGFLDLQTGAFDLSDRGVKGRAATGALEAFVYPERGVYRSGETVFVTALLRDVRGAAVPALPLTLVVRRPDGVEQRRAVVEDQGLGGRAFSLPLMGGAMRGTWRVTAYADPKGPSVGEATFLVEDYVPERLELTLTPKEPALRPGQPAEIDVEARYLFGAPGAALEVSGEVVVGAATGFLPGLPGYAVGLEDEAVEASTVEIEAKGTTDARGRVSMQIPVQEAAAPRPTEAKIVLRVAEAGGRAVERSVTLPILPAGPVIGVRKTFGDTLAEGGTATFDVVAAAPDGRRIARAASWALYRVERRYQWFNNDGRWGYEPVKTTTRVADGRIEIGTQDPARIAAAVTWGSYRLEVRGEGPDAPATSTGFTVGWSGDQTADVPDLLDMSLDKAAYASGEALKARLSPRFAGTATLAVVSDRVHEVRVVDVPAGGAEVSIPVKAEWGAGAYLVTLAHRPLDQAARRQPGRALGVAWFSVDRAARTLALDLGAPAEMRPRGALTLPIRLTGLKAGEEARVTVAAVDVGILNLTRYQAPDPTAFFFGQKQLGTEIRDLYGFLIDGMQGTRGAIRSGGDGVPSLDSATPTQEPLARYSGVVRVGPDGTAAVTFDIPAFNGTVRVMGVAWTGDRVGHANADVIVRDPVVVAGTLPRFLSVGDQSRVHLQLDNVEGEPGDYTVDLDIRGPVLAPAAELRRTVRLERGGKAAVTIPVTAAGPGTAVLTARLTGPRVDVSQTFALRVQPGTSALVRRDVRSIEPGGRVTLSNDLLADILPGTGAVSAAVSTFSAIDVPGLLQALDRYPYGCSEQIVSRALPLLYVNRLAQGEALAIDGALDERIRGAVERVLARQNSSGAFGLWSVGGDDPWLDAYVTDFLTRAREAGHPVPQAAFSLALDRLRNHVANAGDVGDENGAGLAYAAYVLARNGRPVMGDLRYLADTKLPAFKTALARAQIGAALALLGDRGRSAAVFDSAVQGLRATRDGGLSRADYGTRLRDGAGILALIAEANLPRDAIRPVTQVIAEERPIGRATSTQENAWMILAAQAIQRDSASLALEVGGARHEGALYRTWRGEALERGPVTIANTGTLPAQIVISTTGNPVGPEPAASRGYSIERSYYRLDGSPADPAQVRQNERLVTVLKVTEPVSQYARVLLVDRLPAGLEIDNPKLVDSGTVEALGWLKTEVEPAHAEYRDDRFVAAFDRAAGQPAFFTVAYIVRAVAPGRFVHPPASVEDMYRPERFGRTGFGTVEVVARP